METTNYTIYLGDLGEQEFLVGYTYAPGDPGQVSGPPENCYPPEGLEIELISLRLDGRPVTGQLAGLVGDFLLESDDFAEHLSDLYEESCQPPED